MNEDMAKAPVAKPIPKVSMIDRQIAIAKQRMKMVVGDNMKRFYAEQIIGLRFERGDFPMIQELDKETRDSLVTTYLEEQRKVSP